MQKRKSVREQLWHGVTDQVYKFMSTRVDFSLWRHAHVRVSHETGPISPLVQPLGIPTHTIIAALRETL